MIDLINRSDRNKFFIDCRERGSHARGVYLIPHVVKQQGRNKREMRTQE